MAYVVEVKTEQQRPIIKVVRTNFWDGEQFDYELENGVRLSWKDYVGGRYKQGNTNYMQFPFIKDISERMEMVVWVD